MNEENKIVGIGYNGMPNGCDDDLLPWSRSADDKLNTKYPYGKNALCTHTLFILLKFWLNTCLENVHIQQNDKTFFLKFTLMNRKFYKIFTQYVSA